MLVKLLSLFQAAMISVAVLVGTMVAAEAAKSPTVWEISSQR
jgi:hypothetical protein